MGRVFIFFLILLLSTGVSSQQSEFLFKNITINDGLSQNSVVDIVQDELGFVWFATQDGLNRYDGSSFLIFPETFDDITSQNYSRVGQLFTYENKLWYITKGGQLKVLDLHTHKIRQIDQLGRAGEAMPPISCVYQDRNNKLWLGTFNDGLYCWDLETGIILHYSENGEAAFELAGNKVRSIHEDDQQTLWVLSQNGATRIGEDKPQIFLRGVNSNVITQDGDGSFWVGTFGKGLFYKEETSDTFHRFGNANPDFPRDIIVQSIHADKNGRIWIGTFGKGLYIIDKASGSFINLRPEKQNPNSLPFQDVLSLMEDREGAMWIGTDGGGVSYYNSQFNIFKRITERQVPGNISISQIRAITTDPEGGIWVGTSGQGLTYIDPEEEIYRTHHLEPYKEGIGNYDRIVSLYADESGDLWIGTQGNGLLLKERSTGRIKKWFFSEAVDPLEVIPDNTIWTIARAGEDQVWVGTRNAGLFLLDKELGVLARYPQKIDPDPLSENKNVRILTRINDSILAVGYERAGIQLLNTCSGSFTRIENQVTREILKSQSHIKSLFFSNGFLWAGTAGKGVLVIHLPSCSTTVLNTGNGLPNNMIYGILPESDNSLWMSSNKGIFRIEYKVEGTGIVLEQVQPFTVDDGLQSNEFNTGAYHRSHDGRLFFGGIKGMNYFHPEAVSDGRSVGPVVLTFAMLGNKPLQSDSLITYKSHLELPHYENSISFNYTVLDFLSPQKMKYEYMLEGYDKDWVHAGTRKYTAYTNLPPGDYRFLVKPSNNISLKAEPMSLGISINSPFWTKWWFVISICLLVILILYGIYRYRIYQLLEVQRVKNAISADLHDDIGSRLTSIHFLSSLSKNKSILDRETKSCLESIDYEVEASAEALNEIVWNIKMEDESLEDIVAKMRRYTGEALEKKRVAYTVNIDADFAGKKMGMQKRREMFLVFKELLTNVLKHSEARLVEIVISVKENMFYLSVKDNGKGFDPFKPTDRNGLKNIRERVENRNGRFNIESEHQQGTRIEMFLPFDSHSVFRKIVASFRK